MILTFLKMTNNPLFLFAPTQDFFSKSLLYLHVTFYVFLYHPLSITNAVCICVHVFARFYVYLCACIYVCMHVNFKLFLWRRSCLMAVSLPLKVAFGSESISILLILHIHECVICKINIILSIFFCFFFTVLKIFIIEFLDFIDTDYTKVIKKVLWMALFSWFNIRLMISRKAIEL